jgi:uncharacterized protein YbjT (DUF2867 family)
MTARPCGPERAMFGTVRYVSFVRTRSEFAFEERDRAAARNFAAAAGSAGLRRIIFLGGEASQLSAHLRSRHEVGAIPRAGAVPVTELCAPA